jgi:beta-glucosidase
VLTPVRHGLWRWPRRLKVGVGLALAGVWTVAAWAQTWTNTALSPNQRASALLAAMTLEEKVSMVRSVNTQYIGYVSGNIATNSRLGVPWVTLNDGPAGVRIRSGGNSTTAFPAPISIAATWNRALAREYGAQMGAQARGKGIHVLLGPMMNIPRAYQAGRNFEGSGEDPFLSGQMAAEQIRGIQSQQVMATAKHFVCNDQETLRTFISAEVDERTRQEIYYPAFLQSVRAGVASVMASYNRVNGRYAGENPALNATLKKQWGFGGFVMSDWTAYFSTVSGMRNGMDLDMFSGYYTNTAAVSNALQWGNVAQADLDGMAGRVLTKMFQFGVFDNPPSGNLNSTVTNAANIQFSRAAAAESMVLLKNSGNVLPLGASVASIAVLGAAAYASSISIGSGSAAVALNYNVTPLSGIGQRAGTRVVNYVVGDSSTLSDAVSQAATSDVAIVCVGQQTGEFNDRSSLSLPSGQDALVSAVAAVNPRTIVVVYSSSATLMPWINQVAGVIMAWYPGQENGNALAQVLFGDENPSGKLPVSIPAASSQVATASAAQFPGTNGHVVYSEGLLVGYRWYDAKGVAPLFPFGHGLSYTTFGYSNLAVGSVSPSGQVRVSFDLNNTGTLAGSETAQMYLGFPALADEPPKLLKGFQKVTLAPGQARRVTFDLDWEDLAYWDSAVRAWVVAPGQFQVYVGASAGDIRLLGSFKVDTSIPSSDLANAALFQPVTVSSIQGTNTPGSAAVDGDSASAWSSASGGAQWLTVDLGAARDLSRVRCSWNTNYAAGYSLQISRDSTNWTDAYGTAAGTGGREDILVSGRARFVRVYATAEGVPGGGYSLAELEVYSQPQRPFHGQGVSLPGRVEAEDFDWGGQGVAYGNAAPTNTGSGYRSDDVAVETTLDAGGGYDLAGVSAGQWLEYAVGLPTASAIYNFHVRVAGPGGGSLRLRLDGAVLGTFSFPGTADGQTWQTVSLTNLPLSGSSTPKTLRLEMLSGVCSLNWVAVERVQICGTNNLAAGQAASASSVFFVTNTAASAVDGNPATRWASVANDPQWLKLDLGSVQTIGWVRLNWESGYGQNFSVQISSDNSTWTNAYTTTNGIGSIQDLCVFGSGRYVRLYGTKRGTTSGYSLWEFEVYPATRPSLSIVGAGPDEIISWPETASTWSLESASRPDTADGWSAVGDAPPLAVNSVFYYTNRTDSTAQFYRLKLSP